MVKKFIFLSLIFLFFSAYAQDKALQEGEVYFQAKQYQRAIDAFLKVAQKEGWNEDIAKANLRLGQCYLALEDLKNARKYFGIAKKEKGEIGYQAKTGLALCDIQEEKYDSAIDSLTSIIKEKPEKITLAYAYYNRGIAYERKGWLAKAIEDYQEALTLASDEESLLSSAKARLVTCQAQYEQFLADEENYLQRIKQATRADAIRDLYHELARKCAQVGEIDKGIEYELKSLEYSDDYTYNAGAWMNIAWRYVMKKDYEKAGDAFKKVARDYPQSEYAPEALLRSGDMYSQAKKPDEAIAMYQEFINKYPNDSRVPSALMSIAWRYSDKKDYVKAGETFKRVAEKYPDSESAKEALLRAGDMFSKAGKHEEAIKIYNEFAQKYPDDENVGKALLDIAWRYRAMYLETGDENAKKQKEATLQEIAKRFPDTEIGYFALGLFYEDTGEYSKAIESYKKCAEKNGTQKDVALFGVATCYYDITMIKEAHEYYAKLVEECPDSPLLPNATFFRGTTSSDLGDYNKAIEDYKEVKEKYPESYYAPIASAFIATAYEHLYDYQSALKEYLAFSDVLKKAEELPAHLRHLGSMRGVILLRIGACYLNIGEIEKAREVWMNIKKECPDLKWVGLVGDRLVDSLDKIKKAYGGQVPKIAPTKYRPPEKNRTPISGIITPRNVGLSMGLEGRHIFVYGTHGSQEEKEAGLTVAQALQRMEIKSSRFKPDIKADTEVTEKDIQNRPLILIGTPGSNKIIEEIKDKLPIKIERDKLIVGNRIYKGNEVGLIMVAPNPLNLQQYIVVITGLTPEALRYAVNIHHDTDPNTLLIQTDYLIYDSKSGGPEKPVLEEGFFIKEDMENWHPL